MGISYKTENISQPINYMQNETYLLVIFYVNERSRNVLASGCPRGIPFWSFSMEEFLRSEHAILSGSVLQVG